MNFLRLSKTLFWISIAAVIASIVLIVVWPPRLSIEFTGGTRIELVPADPSLTTEAMETAITSVDGVELSSLNKTQEGTFIIRTAAMDNETYQRVLAKVSADTGTIQQGSFTTIGPTVGTTLKRRSIVALLVATAGIILYIAWAFRKIPRRMNPWIFGVSAVVGLIHDLVIKVGIFTVLSHFTSFEIDTLFATALLSTMGYTVNDKIVILDRVRDNLAEERNMSVDTLIEKSLGQSLTRTLMTGAGVLITLLCLYFFGAESIRWFILAIIVGIVIGTYSSYFVSPPLLILWQKRR